MATTSIISVIQHYQRSIDNSQDDEARLLHCINKLYKLPIKVEHLQETGVGKTVNSLRKFNGEIGVAAKTLVTKWKAMVAAEEESLETNCQSADHEQKGDDGDANGSGGGNDEDDHRYDGTSHPNQTTPVAVDNLKDAHKHRHRESKERNHYNSAVAEHPPECVEAGDSEKATRRSIEKTSKHKSRSQSVEGKDKERHHNIREHKEREKSEHSKRDKEHRSDRSDRSDRGDKDKERHRRHKDEQKKERHKKETDSSNTPSSQHKSSASRSRSDEHNQHQSTGEKELKESIHKERERHNSSKHKEYKKPKEEKSSSSSTSKDKSYELSGSERQVAETESSDRKRRHISDNDSNIFKSPHAKIAKINKSGKSSSDLKDSDNVDYDGIDSSMGANFADVLGMLNMPTKKTKKSLNSTKSSSVGGHSSSKELTTKHPSSSSSSSSSNTNDIRTSSHSSHNSSSSLPISVKPDLLSSAAQLEPLDPNIALELPTISTNYKPMPLNQTVMDCVFNTSSSSASKPVRTLTDAEALNHGISSKTIRTKIYSGVKTGQMLQVPTLFDLCIRVLQKNIDALEYTGGVPFEVIRPVLERATPQQLLIFEEYNPYLMEDSDVLWQQHVQRNYRTQKRQEMESWREMFLRCQEDQERKLNILAESIKQSQKIIAAPVRKTQLAFVDSMVKPPRNIQRKQELYGTKSKLAATPAARVAALSNVTPNAVKSDDVRLRVASSVRDHAQVSSSAVRPKKAPLMQKTLQFMRGRLKR